MSVPLEDYRYALVEKLKLLTCDQWDAAVTALGGVDACRADVVQLLRSLCTRHVTIKGKTRPLLTEFQFQRVVDPDDKGSSLLLKGGRFILVDHIRGGGQGTVYRAHFRLPSGPELPVALKIVSMAGPSDAAAARFKRESEFLCDSSKRQNDLKGNHVVKGHEHFVDGAQSVLAMELLDGQTIDEAIQPYIERAERLPVRKALLLVDSILKGLQFLHEHGCIHRDIKPKNLVHLNRPEDLFFVCIVDLGLVKVPDDFSTLDGQQLGTLYFTAPECFRDAASADVRADLYSVAATLFWMLTGEPPAFELYMRRNRSPLSSKSIRDFETWRAENPEWTRSPLSMIRSEVPRTLCELVADTLSPNRDRRPADVEKFRERFDPVVKITQHARDVKKVAARFRYGLTTAIFEAAKGVEHYGPRENMETFLKAVRKLLSLTKPPFPDGWLLSSDLPTVDPFNLLLQEVGSSFRKYIETFEQQLEKPSCTTAELERDLDIGLLAFQKLLPHFLSLQHRLASALSGIL